MAKRKPTRCPVGAASFPVPIYGGRIILCLTRAAHDKVFTELDGAIYKHSKQVRGVSSEHTEHERLAVYVIGVFDTDPMTTLVHELAHTTFSILKRASIPVTYKNDEPFAYLIDTLYGASVKAMRDIRKRRA